MKIDAAQGVQAGGEHRSRHASRTVITVEAPAANRTGGSALVLAGAAGGFWLVHTQRHAMERPLRIGDEPFLYTVPRGATITDVGRDLERAGLVESAWRLELQARWSGEASRIKTGEYALESG